MAHHDNRFDQTTQDVHIERGVRTLTDADHNAIDRIFFSSSHTTSFETHIERDAFRVRWLGRYITHDPGHFYVARGSAGRVSGYLAGAVDDPAILARFSDIHYFRAWAGLTQLYPAHLHVNLDAPARGAGTGTMLIERFCRDIASEGVIGVHVVTSAGARNVSFYNRNGFAEVGRIQRATDDAVMLAKTLV